MISVNFAHSKKIATSFPAPLILLPQEQDCLIPNKESNDYEKVNENKQTNWITL